MDSEALNTIKAKVTLLGLKIIRYQSEANVLERVIGNNITAAKECGANAEELAKIKGDIEKCETLVSVCNELRPIYVEMWELLNATGDS